MLNVERIKQKLDEFVRKQQEWELAHPEEAKRLKEEEIQERIEEERAERIFWGGQETAENVEEWVAKGHPFQTVRPFDDEVMNENLAIQQHQEKIDAWKADECEKDLW